MWIAHDPSAWPGYHPVTMPARSTPVTKPPAPPDVGVDADPVEGSIAAASDGLGLEPTVAGKLRATIRGITDEAVEASDRRRSEQVRRLLATAGRVTESLDLPTVLSAIVDDARTLLGADSGDMLLLDSERRTLRVVAVSGRPNEIQGFEMAFGEGISTQAIRAGRTLWVDDYASYPHRAPGMARWDFGSVICAPLIFRGEALGALNLHATKGNHRFGADDADLLAAFASHAAIAIDHARRYENEVHLGRTLAETNQELSRSLSVQQRLAEQVLLDGGPAGIAEVLAAHLGRRVVIQDHLRRVIAGASPDGGASWRALLESSSGSGAPGPRDAEGEADPFEVPVRVGRDVAGHLLLSAEQALGSIDRALVDVAVTGVALEFAKIRATLEVEDRLRGEATADLLAGTYPSETAMASRAARLGHDLSKPHDLFVLDIGSLGAAGSGAAHDHERRLVAVARDFLSTRAPRSLAVVHGGSIVVLARRPDRGERDLREFATDLREALGTAGATKDVTVSIGGTIERADAYAPAFAAARRALDVMLKLGRRGAVIGARELGPYALLLQATSRDDLEAFARGMLAPLVEHDRRQRADLIGTLRIYLEEDRVQRRAAARCFVHVNTIVYRIRRVEQLLGRSLDDPSTVFDLTLALRIVDILDAAG